MGYELELHAIDSKLSLSSRSPVGRRMVSEPRVSKLILANLHEVINLAFFRLVVFRSGMGHVFPSCGEKERRNKLIIPVSFS